MYKNFITILTGIIVLFGGFVNASAQVSVNTSRFSYSYDLGPSNAPVLFGFAALTPETTGEINWSTVPTALDRGESTGVNEVNRDFISGTSEVTLNHKIENGTWSITMNMGDVTEAHDQMEVYAEGIRLTAEGGLSNALKEFPYVEGEVSVTDGELNITVKDLGGANDTWVWNRLTISREPAPDEIGTLKTYKGEILRAGPMTFGKSYPGPTAHAQDPNSWFEFKDHHYNAMRLTWTGAGHSINPKTPVWDWPELLENFQKAVDAAAKAEMTVVINYHLVGEQSGRNPNGPDYEMLWLEEFWQNVAPYFKDQENVIYELQNEPIFAYSGYINPTFKTRFLEIYNQVRDLAPERHIIVFSPSPFAYIDKLITAYEDDFDWNYTSAGYHLYSGSNSAPIKRAAALHRTVCTEWDYQAMKLGYVYSVDGYKEGSETLERLGQSWMDWSNHDGPVFSRAFLNADAVKKGYTWWPDAGIDIEWQFPTSESVVFEGSNLDVKITTNNDDLVQSCTLFINGDTVGTDSEAPFEWSDEELQTIAPGFYVLRIVAINKEGESIASSLDLTVFPGKEEQFQTFRAMADAYVTRNGTNDRAGNRLKVLCSDNNTLDTKSYLKFNIQDLDVGKIGAATLRVYNTGDEDAGYLYLHELLNDTWKESDITYRNGPSNTGIPGQMREKRGGENAAVLQFSAKNQWVEYNVTDFVNQELLGDKTLSFMLSNLYESQERFLNRARTGELFSFGSRESDKAPQLLISQIGFFDTLDVEGVEIDFDVLSLELGFTKKLKASVLPATAGVKKVTWSSLDETIATVDSTGIVTANAVGSTTIKAHTKEGNFETSCLVTVIPSDYKISHVPVAYWPFDEAGGGIAHDYIRSADAIWQNGGSTNLSWPDGQMGKAASLIAGPNDKFIVESDPLSGTEELTISAWVKLNKIMPYVGVLSTREIPGDKTKNWGMAAMSSKVDARFDGVPLRSGDIFTTGVWTHIVQTWKNTGESQLFVNGILVESSVLDAKTYNGAGRWWFGDDACCGGRELHGFIDDFAMFDKVLDKQDIYLIYSSGLENKALADLFDKPDIEVDRVVFEFDSLSVRLNDFIIPKYTIYPADATHKDVIIKSSDERIVSTSAGNGILISAGKGIVDIIISTSNDKTDTLRIYVDMDLALKQLKNDSELSIFPNPVCDELNVSLIKSGAMNGSIRILDVLGRTVYSDELAGQRKIRINTSDFKPGSYMLVLDNDDASLQQTRFIKAK